MTNPSFIQQISIQLQNPLPGLAAQSLMMPGGRLRSLPTQKTLDNAQKAAVCIALYQQQNKWHTILIQRNTYKGVHSGQMAFPGGKWEDQDEDLKATAIREAVEEIGLSPNNIVQLGPLSPVYIPPSNSLVLPLMVYLTKPPKLVRQESEVAEIVIVKLKDLKNPQIRKTKKISLANGLHMQTPYFDVYGYTVWGATAAMLSELLALLAKIQPTLK